MKDSMQDKVPETNIPAERQQIEQLLQRARMLLYVDKWETALQEAARALTLDPEETDAHLIAGYCLMELRQYRQAEDEVQAVISQRPLSPSGYRLLALNELAQGYPNLGLAQIEKALALAPDDIDLLAQRSRLLYACQQPQATLEAAEQVLERDPENATARNIRSAALTYLGRHEAGAREADTILTTNPESAFAWYLRGWQLHETGKMTEAKYALLQALSLNPELQVAQDLLLKVVGSAHPLLAVFWWGIFIFKRLPLFWKIYFLFTPLLLCSRLLMLGIDHPEWAPLIIPGIFLSLLLWPYFFCARLVLKLAIRFNWITRTVTPAEEMAWARLLEKDRHAAELFAQGQALLAKSDDEGARQAFSLALGYSPQDREIQKAFITAVRREHAASSFLWRVIFALVRIPTQMLFGVALLLVATVDCFIVELFTGSDATLAIWFGLITGLLVIAVPLLLRLGIQRMWKRTRR
ncbi:MAG: tetratricopeptide repeat protein [Armatimonadota bacterium]